jgi:hypothetical protein
MTSTTFSPAATDTTSSPWVDYSGDIAYIGADDGTVHKITGVFKGTPTETTAFPWPVLLATGVHLTAPVLDYRRGLLMVGGSNGNLYQINTATGGLVILAVGRGGRTNPGIRGAPIVDVTNGTTFVVSANDGTSGVLVEADTATNTQLVKVRIGLASANPAHTAVSLYEPDFSDSYYTDPSTGSIHLCGTGSGDITPWQYAFGFTGTTMQTSPSFSHQLLPSTTARCTGWMEFFNPNVNGGTDFFFFGLTAECTGPGTLGCVVARSSDTALTMAPITGGPSGIVVDNYSTAGSNIYFTAEGTNTAYQFTQNGLQ